MKRRDFLGRYAPGSLMVSMAPELLAKSERDHGSQDPTNSWDRGRVLHILPTVSATELLVKASFDRALLSAPVLHVGGSKVEGVMTDTQGETWQFHAKGLKPATTYKLGLSQAASSSGRRLCEPWELATFPAPDARPENVRVMFFTCAGGHDQMRFLPAALRSRLLRRGLSFRPHAVVSNGDHVYWDQRTPGQLPTLPRRIEIAGRFDRSAAMLGTSNELVLKRAAGPQIVPVYSTDFRSTPVFFVQDDHDYFDNDDWLDGLVTFPPDQFMSQAARATQAMYYPEFLPDSTRPSGMAGAVANGRPLPYSESFGTLRYGRLLEVLLYTIRRTMTLAGPDAVYLDEIVESWLTNRMAARDVAHVVNAPSNPPGWTAGKWGEWYPDVLGADGQLTLDVPKRNWQSGWLKQHDRLLAAMSDMRERIPLVISGDLHATAMGSITRTGKLDLSRNPVQAVLPGTVGTSPMGWPSRRRKTGAKPSLHLSMSEGIAPIEEHGFTLADYTPDRVVLRFFKWNVNSDSPEALDRLEPFKTVELQRPS